jgi:4-methylaminobutanoate oxidase (formaldehyde-forming)
MVEAYGRYYAIRWPGEEPQSARPARRSPLYNLLRVRRAIYGSRFGWERPSWFGDPLKEQPALDGKAGWFDGVGLEHKAVRERAALIDQSSFAKLEVTGKNALAALQKIAANDLDRPDGSCVYTQLCNARGGIEADLTIMRLAADHFYVVTGTGFGVRDFGWIRGHLPEGVVAREVTAARVVINLVGPGARAILATVSDDDVGNAAFPFMAVREIDVGYAPVLAARIGYVGELGYELHVPVDYGLHVYEAIRAAAARHEIADVGYRALESLRLEKGYVYWSADVGPETDPIGAGLGFAVALEKGPFIGRDALLRIKAEGPRRRLCSFSAEGFLPLHGGEPILHEGRVVGVTTSAGYGYTVGRTIALGWLPAELARETAFEVEAFMARHPVVRGPRALYDPKGERLRA